ncbi:Protein GlxC (fragment) [uncultured Defluviicoccus sp.]
MTAAHRGKLEGLLAQAGIDADASAFRRFGSARKLYNFHVDHAGEY